MRTSRPGSDPALPPRPDLFIQHAGYTHGNIRLAVFTLKNGHTGQQALAVVTDGIHHGRHRSAGSIIGTGFSQRQNLCSTFPRTLNYILYSGFTDKMTDRHPLIVQKRGTGTMLSP